MRKTFISLSLLISLLFATAGGFAADKNSGPGHDSNLIQLKNITVDKANKQIRIKSKIAITEGILEYLLVGNQGKTYESVFKVSDNRPSELNFALLLIGCQALSFDAFLDLKDQSTARPEGLKKHAQSLLKIEILKDGQPYDLQRLLLNRERSDEPLTWIYTGGMMIKDHGYAADLESSYIGIWPDPVAVINLFSRLQNPYQGDFGFEMNTAVTRELAVDQNFEILIRKR